MMKTVSIHQIILILLIIKTIHFTMHPIKIFHNFKNVLMKFYKNLKFFNILRYSTKTHGKETLFFCYN